MYRAGVAFILTAVILGTGIAGLLAYDRMDREISGIPKAESREVVIGNHVQKFDLAAAGAQIETVRAILQWVGGLPYAFFEVLFQGAEWVAEGMQSVFFS